MMNLYVSKCMHHSMNAMAFTSPQALFAECESVNTAFMSCPFTVCATSWLPTVFDCLVNFIIGNLLQEFHGGWFRSIHCFLLLASFKHYNK